MLIKGICSEIPFFFDVNYLVRGCQSEIQIFTFTCSLLTGRIIIFRILKPHEFVLDRELYSSILDSV